MNRPVHETSGNSRETELRHVDMFFAKNLHKLVGNSKIPWVFRLVAAKEMLNASFRWLKMVDSNPCNESAILAFDLRVCTWFALGVAGEALCRVKEGKTLGVLNQKMLDGYDDLRTLFIQMTSDQPDQMSKCAHRVRSKYFAHWDEEVIMESLKTIMDDESKVPFSVSHNGNGLSTTFPLCMKLFENDLLAIAGVKKNGDDPVNQFRLRLFEFVLKLSNVLSVLVSHLAQDAGIQLEHKRMPIREATAVSDNTQ